MKSNLRTLANFLNPLLLIINISVLFIACSGKRYTRQEIILNFEKKEKEILTLTDYFRQQIPKTNEVLFEPDGSRYTISIALPEWAITPEHPYDAGRNIKINSAKMDTLLKKLHWTAKTILYLKDLLMKANCKSISSHGDYIQLTYGTDDVCSFWYIISERPFKDSIIEHDTKLGVTFLKDNIRVGSSCAL